MADREIQSLWAFRESGKMVRGRDSVCIGIFKRWACRSLLDFVLLGQVYGVWRDIQASERVLLLLYFKEIFGGHCSI